MKHCNSFEIYEKVRTAAAATAHATTTTTTTADSTTTSTAAEAAKRTAKFAVAAYEQSAYLQSTATAAAYLTSSFLPVIVIELFVFVLAEKLSKPSSSNISDFNEWSPKPEHQHQ